MNIKLEEMLLSLSVEEKKQLLKDTVSVIGKMKWIPNPGPQTQAYYCPADILLYGGQGGGGKSALLLGLALTSHKRSLIMRRQYGDLNALTDEVIRFHGTKDGFNASPPPRLRTEDGRLIEFGAAAVPGSEEAWMGQAHDLLGVDEAVHFLESQIRLLMGWVRSSEEGQRTRTVLATNPPVRAEGQWVIGMFRPWLDPTHDRPAKFGELRWFVTDPDGRDREVPDSTPVEMNGQVYRPLSRTFIHAELSDNPFLVNTNYQASLDALKEPLRSAVRDGNFMAARVDDPDQLIPTDWLWQAQKRWTSQPPKGVPMCAIGVDVAQGGVDNTVLAIRHNGWYAPLITVPGDKTPGGHEVAGLVVSHRRDDATVIIDMGGGYGGAAKEHLQDNGVAVVAYKGMERRSKKSKKDQLSFKNNRTEAYWNFREAIDPNQRGGSFIALPDDPELIQEFAILHFRIESGGIELLETKLKCKELLNRSPDKSDAVVMAWWAGQKGNMLPEEWAQHMSDKTHKKRPEVIRASLGKKRPYGRR